jgi:hypothetical protein
MRIGCVCPTYKRPQLLGRAIHCFLQQTHPDCYLVVLDDAGQYSCQEHHNWTLISTSRRYKSLGGKRQAGINMLPKNCDGYMCWDDDDVYFPHAVASVSRALERGAWAQCRVVWETSGHETLVKTEAFTRRRYGTHPVWGYGGCWAYRLEEHRQVGGYPDDPARSSNDDVDLANTFFGRFGESVDSSVDGPWYWYCRDPGVNKVCVEGVDFWEKRKLLPMEQIAQLTIGWNGPDIYQFKQLPERPRPLGWQAGS